MVSKQTGLHFNKLSEEAKEVARTWYRDCMMEDFQSEIETLDKMFNEKEQFIYSFSRKLLTLFRYSS